MSARRQAMAAVVTTGTPWELWCSGCRAFTLLAAELLLLAPDGVSVLDVVQWCEVCDDLDHPPRPRRTDRA
ncbi:hypothetical protein [Streptomyces sp. NRRL S-350]|uniref:hypothetical protein n=1 Tax=Streptomyces sp. NRRL S-350 TaxID=1463902 RepID=UPI0004BF1E36|nr:hypothetical protein [Streptomyces sp. NRRL S-350]